MGRFSRVKGGCGKKSEVPNLEAHFPDGAWYDIVLRAADPSRNRFLVQVSLIRYQPKNTRLGFKLSYRSWRLRIPAGARLPR